MHQDERYDLGIADTVEAEAIGTPGKRTFKITATSDRGVAVVWLEKEQLFRVAVAIRQFLAAGQEAPEHDPSSPGTIPSESVDIEFKAGEMSLRFDASAGLMTLVAAPIETSAEDEALALPVSPEVEFSFTRPVAETLAGHALRVCAAGRKPCPLCGGPIDPDGHFCVKTNGHRPLDFSSE